ncbi:low-molecular weight cobalt-containing nitrile hydratase subunit beta [Defluviimonas sp. 20V17]|uniref:Nitrile hydratase subunit beta n=1 Tax=Allgaiera indica TaxID=765699 RepID=A0AAN4UMR3_9RHOB|nr:nitrile hydratase subunit beta [Allgaiera indica]KDB03504.1 low-molecular weight cobalt-containing nitrile hydratase subunit beta [Defluviimonas sp. 20V17]GHD98086.1 nitrile hydratase subunit beta protein [Allgaiera indica]SDW54245.1 nitrile hydratase [Allgaiera indica]
MNGPQDLGGRHGFGPVVPEAETTRFHADWEKRVLGVTLACGALGHWNIDSSRHARESLPPAIYYNASYYEIWLRALSDLLERAGEIGADELAAGHAMRPGLRSDRRLAPADVAGVLARGGPADRPGPAPAFAVGDRVRTRNHQPAGHTRLPGYARGHVGRITAMHGAHIFPDRHAHAPDEDPKPLYTVQFDAAELYGAGADPTLTVSIEAWEPYLEHADA